MPSIVDIGERVVRIVDRIATFTMKQMLDYYDVEHHKAFHLYPGKEKEIIQELAETIFNNLPSELYVSDVFSVAAYEKELVNKILIVLNNPEIILGVGRSIAQNILSSYSTQDSFNNRSVRSINVSSFRFFSVSDYDIWSIIDQDFDDVMKEDTPVLKSASFTDFHSEIYDRILKNPQLLNTMNWRDFEKLLARLLAEFGYEIELTKSSKDGGIDVIAITNDKLFGAHKYLVQAKRWKDKVGVEPIRELGFLQHHYGATKSCLATTSRFTAGAWETASMYKWQLELRDFDGLMDWVRAANLIQRGR